MRLSSNAISAIVFAPLLLACSGDTFEAAPSAGAAGGSAGAGGMAAASGSGSVAGQSGSGVGGQAGTTTKGGAAGAAGAAGVAGGAGSAGDGGKAAAAGASGVAGAGGTGGDAGAAGTGGTAGVAGAAGMGGAGGNTTAGSSGAAGAAGAGGAAGQGGAAGNTTGGSSGFAGAAGSGGSGSGTIVYVSPTGNDQASGLTPQTPVKTIKTGLQKAGTGPATVRVCAGEYTEKETLEIGAGVTLSGGWDCASFTRQAKVSNAQWCDPLVAAQPVEGTTRLRGESSPVLSVSAAGTTIDAIDIVGTTGGVHLVAAPDTAILQNSRIAIDTTSTDVETSAVLVTGGSPRLVNNCIAGGGGVPRAAGTQIASAGLVLEKGTKATVTGNEIQGGNGLATDLATEIGKPDGKVGFGSVGAAIVGAQPVLTGNVIDGGTGSSFSKEFHASVGLYVSDATSTLPFSVVIDDNIIRGGEGIHMGATTANAGVLINGEKGFSLTAQLTRNEIRGGAGKHMVGSTPVSVGILGTRALIDIIDNFVVGGTSQQDTSRDEGVAVSLRGASGSRIERNRLIGANGGYHTGVAIALSGAANTRVANNMIFPGSLSNTAIPGDSVGVDVGPESPNVRILHNTIVLPWARTKAIGVRLARGTSNEPYKLDLRNNLLVGTETVGPVGVQFDGCPATFLEKFAGNAFANLDGKAIGLAGLVTDCPSATSGDLAGFVTALESPCINDAPCLENTKGNVTLQASCGSATTCVRVEGCSDTLASCGEALFESFSKEDGGITSALKETAFTLRGGLSCNVVQSPATTDVTADFFGESARTLIPGGGPSRGADEAICKKN